MNDVIIPPALKPGDTVVFVSPAGTIKNQFVTDAAKVLERQGWKVKIARNALGKWRTFSGTPEARYTDLSSAILDPDVKAIFCSRGGYGVVHLLDRLDKLPLRANPKWIIGYSDISALHALMNKHGIASIHAPMAKHISTFSGKDEDSQSLFKILKGEMPEYHVKSNPLNRFGTVTGKLIGGNLAVIADLISTPFDVFKPRTILFIEDISEPIYKTERILYQLKLSGVLASLGGLIVGQFTEYSKDVDGRSMESMIAEMVKEYKYPVAYGVPVGHVDHNIPLVEGVTTTLSVTISGTIISQK